MIVHRVTRRLEIDAGHRLLLHESACQNVHGHRYVFDITVSASKLDEVGRVVDFSVIKNVVGPWLDGNWDHAFIAQEGDPIIDWLRERGMRLFVMDVAPTAENLAAHLLEVARSLLSGRGVRVDKVRCYETPNCWAEAL